TSVTQKVTVSRSLAQVSVNIYNEAGEVVRHLYVYTDDPGNMNMGNVLMSRDMIQPSMGTPTGSGANLVTLTFPNGLTLSWDGKNDNGQIVTNGVYEVEIHWNDGNGGEGVITRSVTVENRPG